MAPPQMEYRTSHSSSHADIQLPPRDVHSPAPEGLALPTNGLRDSHHVPRLNGVLNGSAPNGSSAGLIEVREVRTINCVRAVYPFITFMIAASGPRFARGEARTALISPHHFIAARRCKTSHRNVLEGSIRRMQALIDPNKSCP